MQEQYFLRWVFVLPVEFNYMEIDDKRWWIGWRPTIFVLGIPLLGLVLGFLVDSRFIEDLSEPAELGTSMLSRPPILFPILGFVAGLIVAYWGAAEINANYSEILGRFSDTSGSAVQESTSGLQAFSTYSFIDIIDNSSPLFVQPCRKYRATHLVFGERSVIMNREHKYDLKRRKQVKGGQQEEILYDQISSIYTENYKNYGELKITLSSGNEKTITSDDIPKINDVKSDLQKKMRQARQTE